jgi:hypothetical protein
MKMIDNLQDPEDQVEDIVQDCKVTKVKVGEVAFPVYKI